MIIEEKSLLPLVHFDVADGWDSVRRLCSGCLDERGLQRLTSALKTNVCCVAVEHHYIDKDYRDTFSNFHSKRFSTPDSRCIRLHFFSRAVTHEELKETIRVQADYLGYSIIRPTRPNCIARTLIDLKNYAGLGGYVCSCSEKVSLQGTELHVEGFPFISQDADATVCAQSALWMTVRYYSNRYALYSETYPFQLTQLAKDYSIGRIYPSSGLTMWQLGESMRQLGFSPLIYDRGTFKGDFERLLYTYIESGIPVIAGVPNHVVSIFGHLSDLSQCAKQHENGFSSDFCTGWIMSDDNCSPCTTLLKGDGGASKYKAKDIDSFIAPLAEKIFLPAENFEEVILRLLKNAKIGLAALSPELSGKPLVQRMFLTTVKSFKKRLAERGMGNPEVEGLYRQLPLPHFIWVCELSDPEEFAKGNVLGEVVWDATRNVWETEGWIAIHYPEVLLIDAGSALNGPQNIRTFPLTHGRQVYPMYRSNLKEI